MMTRMDVEKIVLGGMCLAAHHNATFTLIPNAPSRVATHRAASLRNATSLNPLHG